MKTKKFKSNPFATKVRVFFQPIQNLQFNAYPFLGGVSTMNNANIKDVVHKYKDRFKEAWEELSER